MPVPADPIKSRPIYQYLLIQTFLSAMALQGWNAIYNNFAVNVAGLAGNQIGLIQSLREVPGLLSVSLILILLFLKEMRLFSLCMLLVGIGACLAGFLPSFAGLLCCTLLTSIGFHYIEAMTQSMTLQHYSLTEAPVMIGILRSATAAASFAIGLTLFLLSGILPYPALFILCGTGSLAGGVWGLTRKNIDAPGPIQRYRLIFKKKYWIFYTITLFSGARRQIFMVFSALLLIERFGFTLREMTFLFLLNNLVNWILNKYIGKVINSVGESRLLTAKYAALALVFAAYAHSESSFMVALLYIMEQLFFNFTVALRTFFQKIADPGDISATMALGVTINHIVAVLVPALGGILWMHDHRLPFYLGVGFALIALLVTRFMDRQIPRATSAAAS